MAPPNLQNQKTVPAAPAVGGAPNPMDDPANREKVELAKAFAFQLLKGIKQIGLYRHNDARFAEFLAPAHDALATFGEKFGPLSLRVEPKNFSLIGQEVFQEDSSLPYKFFRDGIRQLIFRPGLAAEELVSWTLIALSEPERGGEDILAQLWRHQFEHIEYVVVEGFSMEGSSDEQVNVEVDTVVGYLYTRLQSTSDDFLRFARLNAEDLDTNFDEVEQIRGAVISGTTAPDDLKAKLQREIHEDETSRLFPKLVTAVFQVVESGLDDPKLVEEMIIQLLDALLMQEDLATINQIVLKLRAMEKSTGSEVVTTLLVSLISRMGEEQRLTRVGEILRTTRPKNPLDLTRYLQALGAETIPILIPVLQSIEVPENRMLLLDVLAQFAKELPDPFVNHLQSDHPQTVRDMVYVLEKSQNPGRIKMFAQVLKHRNLAVRLEAMGTIARGRTGEARRLIAECLGDEHPQVRSQAARMLPEFDHERAFIDLSVIASSPEFEKRGADERQAFFGAIGSTGTPGALTFLKNVLNTKAGLLNKKKVHDDKLLAVHGLGASGSVQALKLLQELLEDKTLPPEILAAVRKGIYQNKKVLFPDQAPEAGERG